MLVKQYGAGKADEVALRSYSEAASLDTFSINAGDSQATLIGARLDEVAGGEVNGIRFAPAGLSRADNKDELRLATDAKDVSALHAGDKITAHITLNDGRVLNVEAVVGPARPRVTLLNKTIQPGPTPSAIRLGSQDELPQDGKLSFFLHTEIPETFPRSEKIEVATADASYSASLSLDDGTLVPQDGQTVMAVFDPLKSLGAFCLRPASFPGSERQCQGRLAASGDPGAVAHPEGSALPGESRPAMYALRNQPLSDRRGGFGSRVQALGPGSGGICAVNVERAAS